MERHVKLQFFPKIEVTAERAAEILGISLEKADKLLSGEDTYEILRIGLSDGIQRELGTLLQGMARRRWPSDTMPIRIDCSVDLPELPELKGVL